METLLAELKAIEQEIKVIPLDRKRGVALAENKEKVCND